jgi:hypothetical protein
MISKPVIFTLTSSLLLILASYHGNWSAENKQSSMTDALLASLPPAPAPRFHCGDNGPFASVTDCHTNYSTGCTRSAHPGYDGYLNLVKNLLPSPNLSPESPPLTKASVDTIEGQMQQLGLNNTNHEALKDQLEQLGEGHIRSVQGYLYYAFLSNGRDSQHPSGETCNCQLTQGNAVDYHIGIGFDPFPTTSATSQLLAQLRQGSDFRDLEVAVKNLPNTNPRKKLLKRLGQQSMVVEITPHYRAKFFPGWLLRKLQRSTGLLVTVTGQLMVDNVHASPGEDCGFPNSIKATCWRKSAWELHPVTQFLVCTNQASPTTCAPNSWVKLADLP